jgi:hypothetical protein
MEEREDIRGRRGIGGLDGGQGEWSYCPTANSIK